MTNAAFDELFGAPPRKPERALTQRHMDLAASIQAVTEEVVLRLTRSLARRRPARKTSAWPAASRSTASPTARCCATALRAHLDSAGRRRCRRRARRRACGLSSASATQRAHVNGRLDAMQGAYLGPAFEQAEIERRLTAAGAQFDASGRRCDLLERDARRWPTSKAVGWFQGRMEFGPRALGATLHPRRSALARRCRRRSTSRSSTARASGPFAPSVLREDVADWFELDGDSPYMLLVADVVRRASPRHDDAEKALFGIDKLNVRARTSRP